MITLRQLDRELYDEAREQGRDVEELVSGIASQKPEASCDHCGEPATGRLWTGEVTCDQCAIGKDGEFFEELSDIVAGTGRAPGGEGDPSPFPIVAKGESDDARDSASGGLARTFGATGRAPAISGRALTPAQSRVVNLPSQRDCGIQELALPDAGEFMPPAKAAKAEAPLEAGRATPRSGPTSRHSPA